MYAFLCPQTAKKFIYEHAIVMQSFFRQNWLVIIFMMLVKQLLSNQSTRIKQNSAMSRQIKFYSIRNEPIETFLSCRPLFMAAGAYHFHEPITQPEIQTLRNLVNRFSLSRFWIRMFDIFFNLLSSTIHKIYWHQFEPNQSFSWQEIMIYYL